MGIFIPTKLSSIRQNFAIHLGLDFSAKFKRPISRQCVCNIIQQKEEIKAFVEADPVSAKKETENETVQKLCYEMDQMYIEEDFGTEDDVQELVTCYEQDEELISLVVVPENQEHKLPEKPQIQTSIITFLTKK